MMIVQYMLSELHIQIASKFACLILETRYSTRKTLFERLQKIFDSFKHNTNPQPIHTPQQFLNSVVPKDTYHIHQKLAKMQRGKLNACVEIKFELNQRTNGHKVHVQHWYVEVARKKMEESSEELKLISAFFDEAVLVLRKLPLLKVYRNDADMKRKYFLNYSILISKGQNPTMFELPGIHLLQRKTDSLILRTKVAYNPFLDDLMPKQEYITPSKRKESATLSDYNQEKTFSVYTFYNQDENFHFLSSDQQTKDKQKQEIVEKIDLTKQESSEEYQLLIISDDENFVDENREYFQQLNNFSKDYIFP